MIGPSVPEHLLKSSQSKDQYESPPSVDNDGHSPIEPPSNNNDDLDDDDLADEFMPELPPDLLPQAPAPTGKRRTMGPARPPPASTTNTSASAYDDEDDTIGPIMPSQYDRDQAALSSTITDIEKRAKQSEQSMMEAASGSKKVERPEWMLAPPDVDYLKNANTGRTRTFNQRTVDAATRDSSGWTDTPADKARKQQQGETNTAKSTSRLAPPPKPTQAELETRRKVEQHNRSERSMSLLELHRMNKGKKRKTTTGTDEDPSKRPFDREKDLMGSRQMSKKQKKELLEKSSEWSDRFSSNTRSGSFL